MIQIDAFRKEYIKTTLKEVRELVKNNQVRFQFSRKNDETFKKLRRSLGITLKDFQEEILEKIEELKLENYYEGPKTDYDIQRDLIFWIFGIVVFNTEIYLKFNIVEEEGKEVVLWSYHIPEHPINYEFK